jgi:hypothetical protein
MCSSLEYKRSIETRYNAALVTLSPRNKELFLEKPLFSHMPAFSLSGYRTRDKNDDEESAMSTKPVLKSGFQSGLRMKTHHIMDHELRLPFLIGP